MAKLNVNGVVGATLLLVGAAKAATSLVFPFCGGLLVQLVGLRSAGVLGAARVGLHTFGGA